MDRELADFNYFHSLAAGLIQQDPLEYFNSMTSSAPHQADSHDQDSSLEFDLDPPPSKKPRGRPRRNEDSSIAFSSNPESLTCRICSRKFTASSSLRRHELSHSGNTHPFSCSVCGQKFTQKSSLDTHIKRLHASVNAVYPCKHCEQTFLLFHKLKRHLKEHRSPLIGPELRYPCDKCERSFRVKRNLESHEELVHTPNPNCPATLKDPLDTNRFPCSVCGKSFPLKSRLAKHMVYHGERLHKCLHPGCLKSFKTKQALRLHTDSVHLRLVRHKSAYCDRVFRHSSERNKHNRFHREKGVCLKPGEGKGTNFEERDQAPDLSKKHACDICGKRFRVRNRLNTHMLSHSDVRDFLCTQCGKEFKNRRNLRDHTRKAHGIELEPEGNVPPRGRIGNSGVKVKTRRKNRESLPGKRNRSPIVKEETSSSSSSSSDSEFQSDSFTEEMSGTRKSSRLLSRSFQCKLCSMELRTKPLLEQHMSDNHRVSVKLQKIQQKSNRRVIPGGMWVLELENLPGTNADPLAQWFLCDKCSWATSNVHSATLHSCKPNDNEMNESEDRDWSDNDNNGDSDAIFYPEVKMEGKEEEEVALIPLEDIKVEYPDFQTPLMSMTTALVSELVGPILRTNPKKPRRAKNGRSSKARSNRLKRLRYARHLKEGFPNGMTPEEMKARNAELTRIRRSKESDEKKEARRRRNAEAVRKRRAAETLEEKAARRKMAAETVKRRRALDKEYLGPSPRQREVCEVCGKSVTQLAKHMKTHVDKTIKCDKCEFTTNSKYGLVRHCVNIHSTARNYLCDQCDYAAKTLPILRNHMRTHTGEKPHKCHLCSYASIQKSPLDIHIRRAHTGEKPFRCEDCDYAHYNRMNLIIHRRKKHTGEKPYKCGIDGCEFATYSYVQIWEHRGRRHPNSLQTPRKAVKKRPQFKPYNCRICGRSFYNKTVGKNHEFIQHGPGNPQPYTCNVCKQKFTQVQNVRTHIRKHHPTHLSAHGGGSSSGVAGVRIKDLYAKDKSIYPPNI